MVRKISIFFSCFLLLVSPLAIHADDQTSSDSEEVNTDYSQNVDLALNGETYTVNLRFTGNWDLIPDESTYYRDEYGNTYYGIYDADWDDDDIKLTAEAGESISVNIIKVEYSHNESDNFLTAKVYLKYQRSSSNKNRLWFFKEVETQIYQSDTLEVTSTNTTSTN